MARRLLQLGLMVGSLVASLMLAEGMATLAAGNAYPFLNLFEPDPTLGVVLEAEAATRIRSRSGRITAIETDAHGRRRHPRGHGPVILLLGDSQVFGYHVEAEHTVAAYLADTIDAQVVTAAVPSYGPTEYVAVAADLVPKLRPDMVVFVANLANDWWESNVPNIRRSTARDGWLTSRSLGTDQSDFPGRRFFFGRSHLVLAFRRVAAHATIGASTKTPDRLLRDVGKLRAKRQRFTPYLGAVQRIAKASNAEVLAVALPLDVMVDDREWSKYGRPVRDLSALAPLVDDYIDEARTLGIGTLDLGPPLRAASPGAFLDDDPHLSPKGHRAFADAIIAVRTAGQERS